MNLLILITAIIGILIHSAAGGLQPAAHNLQHNVNLQLIYTAETGVREATGRNDGTRVEQYLRYAGLPKGNPWCASFVCWCLGQAGIPNPRSGWCPDLFPAGRIIWQRSRGAVPQSPSTPAPPNAVSSHTAVRSPQLATRNPQPTDVFGLYFPEKKRIAHVGFIDQWGETYAITVEGNTNQSGSREGDGVYRKRRLISTIYAVARWTNRS